MEILPDFAGSTGGTTSYNGMSNVTINLTR